MEEKKINILDVAIVLAKHKKFIILTTLIVSILTVVYSLVSTQYWTSTAVVEPIAGSSVSSSSINLGGIGSSMLGGLGSRFGLSGGDEGVRQVAIVESRTFLERVIQEFNLYDVFEIDEPDVNIRRDLAIRHLSQRVLSVEYSTEKGLIYISVKTDDKELSAKMANYIHEELDKYNKNERKNKATETRKFIEKRIEDVNSKIEENLAKMSKFQKENSFIEDKEQINNIITAYSTVVSAKIEKEIQLDYLSNYISKDSKQVLRLKEEIKSYNEQLKKFEQESENRNLPSYITPLNKVPDLASQYALIKMNIEIYQEVYQFLFPQLEMAKIEETKNSTTLQVLDLAVPAGLRTWPRRGLLCIAMFFLSIFVSSCWAIFIEIVNVKMKNKETKEKLDKLKKCLK